MPNTAAAQSSIGAGQTMNSDAARYWKALVDDIAQATGIAILATEGTRTYARQKYLYDGYRAGKPGFNPAWSPDSPYAYHLSGRAVDVGSNVGFTGTRASREFYSRAGRYGFRPTVKGEPWHFEWRADWVGVSLDTAGSSAVVIPSPTPASVPAPSEEDDMTPDQSEQLARIHAALFAGLEGVDPLRRVIVQTRDAVVGGSARFAFVRAKNRPEVFLSVDRQSLRWLETEKQLADQRYTLSALGAKDLPVQEVDNLAAFGSIGSNERPADPFYKQF